MNRRFSRTLLVVATLLVALVPRVASAIPDYPEKLRKAARMPCPPPCTVCHLDMSGGIGTAEQPFGQAMVGAGLDSDPDTFLDAAKAVFENDIDSDGDGLGDFLELDQGRDPNIRGDASVCGPDYGCARVARADPFRGDALLSLLVAAGLLLGRRLPRRRR